MGDIDGKPGNVITRNNSRKRCGTILPLLKEIHDIQHIPGKTAGPYIVQVKIPCQSEREIKGKGLIAGHIPPQKKEGLDIIDPATFIDCIQFGDLGNEVINEPSYGNP